MIETMSKIKVTELVWDAEIYPRLAISDVHVGQIADALRSGATIPPIIVDAKTKRIVDGVHRWRATQRVFGTDAEISCEEREFESENALFLAAIEANADHGLRYSAFEQTKNILRAEERGISRDVLSKVMRVTPEKLERIVETKTGFRRVGNDDVREALKPALRPLKGKRLSKEQQAANQYSGGLGASYYINQTILLVKAGLGKRWGGQNVKVKLKELRDLLNKNFK